MILRRILAVQVSLTFWNEVETDANLMRLAKTKLNETTCKDDIFVPTWSVLQNVIDWVFDVADYADKREYNDDYDFSLDPLQSTFLLASTETQHVNGMAWRDDTMW